MIRIAENSPAVRRSRRIAVGDVVTARELTTIQSERVRVPAPDALTHLQFRRFAGCPACNVHLRSVAKRHDEIRAAGIREVAMFHSSVEAMLPYQGDLPFAVVADPARKLYAAFGVETSPRANLHPRVWLNLVDPRATLVVLRGRRNGGRAGFRGETILGLPADFLIDPDGVVRAVQYGRHANDHWSVDELLALARS